MLYILMFYTLLGEIHENEKFTIHEYTLVN